MSPRSLRRFSRYTIIGVTTFGIDLVLLWLLMEFVLLHVFLATSLAFFAAVSLNYFISRSFAFRGTERRVWHGYKNFIGIAVGGALITSTLMWVLTAHTSLDVALARILIAALVGIGNYLINLYFNFRVVGKDL